MNADFDALYEQALRYIAAGDTSCAEQALADARGVVQEMQAHCAEFRSSAGSGPECFGAGGPTN